MTDKEKFNHILQQLDALSTDLHDLAADVSEGRINDTDDTMVNSLAEFAESIAVSLQELLQKNNLL